MKEKLFESIFIDFEVDGKKIVFGTIYRSPNCCHDDFLVNLSNVLSEGTKLSPRLIISGDFNYDLLNSENTNVNMFTDTFFEFGLYPLINIPTRITDTTAKVLDHVWTNILDRPIRTAVLCNPISDHLPTFVNIAVNKAEKKRNYKKEEFF